MEQKIDASFLDNPNNGMDFKKIANELFINVKKEIKYPPTTISVGDYQMGSNFYPIPFGTAGNFSTIVGAPKSMKTFFKSLVLASYIGGQSIDYAPTFKTHRTTDKYVLDFDTEQGEWHSQKTFKRVPEMVGAEYKNYKPFYLRKLPPKERLQFIEWCLMESDFKDNIGLVSIDGIADLVNDVNDLTESNNMTQKLMEWTDKGKFHLIRDFSRNDLTKCALLCFLNPCLYYIILFKGYDALPAQEAMVINFSWPIMLVILSIPILKQTIDIKSFLSIIVCYFGVVVIATNGDVFSMHFENPFGVLLMLISTVIWSLFWLFNTKNSNDSLVSLFLIFMFSFPFILIFVFLSNSFVIPSFKGLIGSIYVGCFEMGVSLVLWQSALKISTTVSRIASLVFITPFLSLVILHFVLGETKIRFLSLRIT